LLQTLSKRINPFKEAIAMWNEDKLDALLAEPSIALCEDIARLDGDVMVLGAGGKMGPSLCALLRNALDVAGVSKRVVAVSRFSDPASAKSLHDVGIEAISVDLQDPSQVASLPAIENIIYMAGRKFDTFGSEWRTWGSNAVLPAFVSEKFKNSRIVVFSSGNIYPMVAIDKKGCSECEAPSPIGEYAMSCLARERVFEYASNANGTKILLFRLNYAVDLRYGALCDICGSLVAGKPISLRTPCFNIIWQGSANEYAIRSLLLCDSPPAALNATGPEIVSVQRTAERMGEILGIKPTFVDEPFTTAFLSDASKAFKLFGYPKHSAEALTDWQAQWFLAGGRVLGKPTHFQERGGKF
jgi:nucleoside-diphosphate-sugar epimerase